jgi:hypothetical protein
MALTGPSTLLADIAKKSSRFHCNEGLLTDTTFNKIHLAVQYFYFYFFLPANPWKKYSSGVMSVVDSEPAFLLGHAERSVL